MSQRGHRGLGQRNKPPRAAPDAFQRAVGLLSRREHSARELKAKLALRGHAGGESVAAIERLKDLAWQDEDRFGASLARRRAAQGYGPRRIQAELKSHGLADDAIRAALAALEVDWTALAAAQVRRRPARPADGHRAARAAQAAFLLRRGFDAATVRAVTRTDTGDLDDGIDR